MDEKEEARALFVRGQQAYYGFDGAKRDIDAAKKLYLQAAWLGDKDAMCCLGDLFLRGKDGEKDARAAADWYLRAQKCGSRAAAYVLGLEIGFSEFADVEAYRRAHPPLQSEEVLPRAEAGESMAQTALGSMYEYGVGVKRTDLRSAFKWYEKAARKGDPQAQFSLAMLYEERGFRKEGRPAAGEIYALLRSAAGQGFPRAIEKLERAAMLAASFAEALGALTDEELSILLDDGNDADE